MNSEIRSKVWRGSLDADLQVRYFSCLRADYYNHDMRSKIFFAIMSSSVVGGWVIWNDASKYPNGVVVWKVLSAASALLAIVMPIVDFAKKLEASGRLKGEWTILRNEYDILWLQIENGSVDEPQAIERLRKLAESEAALGELEASLPLENKALIKKCQNEVKVARGLA